MQNLLLSIFPGIDLLGRAFEETGYCVVRGPDVIWGSDIRTFQPPAGVFEGIIGGDPCQAHSALVHLVRHNGNEPRFPDMSPDYQRVVEEAQPRWYVRENVPGAPLIEPTGYDCWSILLVDAHVGGVQPRERRISFGMREGLWTSLWSPMSFIEYREGTTCGQSINGGDRAVPVKIGGSGKLKLTVMAGHDGWAPLNPTARAKLRAQRSVVADARQGTAGSRVMGGGGVLPHGQTILTAGQPTYYEDGAVRKAPVLPIEDACEAQGLPRDFTKYMPFTMHGKRSVIGNGVPLSMGRAIAAMVHRATTQPSTGDQR